MNATPETVAAVALDILRKQGWHQGVYYAGPDMEGVRGPLCISAAMNKAAGSTWAAIGNDLADDCAKRSCAVLGIDAEHGIEGWNDDPHTTFEDVTLVLKRVANGEGVE